MMKHVVITGANRGIGLALARIYSKDHHVTAVCRSSSEALEKLPNTQITANVNMNSKEAIKQAIGSIETNIDIMICNAGILEDGRGRPGNIDIESIVNQLNINAIAPIICVEAALSKFASKAKVILITSRMGSIKDNTSGGYYGYRMSKAALNAAGKSLAIDLQKRNIALAMLHPGMVSTEMTHFAGSRSADEAASELVARIHELTMGNTGKFLHANSEELPW